MKIAISLLLAGPVFAISTLAQSSGPASNDTNPGVVVESGADYRVWERRESAGSSAGGGHMVELATGMNFWDGSKWAESVARFQPNPKDASFVATQVQHPARIASDINVEGAISLRTPDGQLLSSAPVGIALYDPVSGQSLLLSTITNTPGVLVSSNQVFFENAFKGGACASVLYTIERDSFAQDIVFSGYLDPQNYGFSTNFARIQIITEFFQPPTPDLLRQPMYIETNQLLRTSMASPDLFDATITFGRVVIGAGQAYTAPSLLEPGGASTLVAKDFVQTPDGRYFLVESVPYAALQSGFYSLPDCSPTGPTQGAMRHDSLKGMLAQIPVHHSPLTAKRSLAGSLAQGSLPKARSVVIDYRATLNSGATLLQADITYLVSGNLSCSTLTAEGGAVLKYKSGTSVTVSSLIPKNSGLYRPVVFTAVDDDTVGESMNGYTNSGWTGQISSSGYANPALKLGALSLNVSGCVFRYAQKAIQYAATSLSGVTINVTHAQLYKCIRGVDLTWAGCGCCGGCSPIYVNINNAVNSGVQYPIYYANLSSTVIPTVINCTIDQATQLVGGSGSLSYDAINCVYANITNSTSGTFAGNNNGFFNSAQHFGSGQLSVSVSPFQSAGAGNYYLTDASGFRNAGTSSGVSGSLISDLGKRTTYPPFVVAATTLNTPQTYSFQAYRDTDTLDLGYHYDPLDWELGGVLVTNTSVTITMGAAIGVFGTNTMTYGLAIGQQASLQCQGAPNQRNWFVQFNTVQEQPYTNWFQTSGGALSSEFQGSTPGSVINCRLTSWSTLAQAVPGFSGITNTGPLNFQDCEFHGGTLISSRPTVNLTNCLLERVYTDLEPKDGLTNFFRVGAVYGGAFTFGPTNSLVQDVLFDNTAITNWNGYSGGYNAYVTGAQRLQPTKTTDIILSASPSYQVGTLGNYYQLSSSTLFNGDTSTTADQVGLYHYTTITNLVSGYQIKETNSWVDVSYHYVATDTNGIPIDSNSDGIPDYLAGPGTWTNTGSLLAARYFHTETLLNANDQILVAGGNSGSGFLASAELYNPTIGTWTNTGSMTTAREQHTAIQLPNGNVLVVGGQGANVALTNAELYRPTSGTWTNTGSLNIARFLQSGVVLSNGIVLVAGGEDSGGNSIASAELYNPATGTWATTGSLNTSRFYHTATLLPNGEVLVAGGFNGNVNTGTYIASAELYNPATGTWTTTGSMNVNRYAHTAILLVANGKVLVAGGGGTAGISTDAELYDPTKGTWTTTGSLNTARYAHTGTLLPNSGAVLVAGGLGNFGALTSAELYNPVTGTWTTTGSLTDSRYTHTASFVTANGKVLAVGGYGTPFSVTLSSCELYQP